MHIEGNYEEDRKNPEHGSRPEPDHTHIEGSYGEDRKKPERRLAASVSPSRAHQEVDDAASAMRPDGMGFRHQLFCSRHRFGMG